MVFLLCPSQSYAGNQRFDEVNDMAADWLCEWECLRLTGLGAQAVTAVMAKTAPCDSNTPHILRRNPCEAAFLRCALAGA